MLFSCLVMWWWSAIRLERICLRSSLQLRRDVESLSIFHSQCYKEFTVIFLCIRVTKGTESFHWSSGINFIKDVHSQRIPTYSYLKRDGLYFFLLWRLTLSAQGSEVNLFSILTCKWIDKKKVCLNASYNKICSLLDLITLKKSLLEKV